MDARTTLALLVRSSSLEVPPTTTHDCPFGTNPRIWAQSPPGAGDMTGFVPERKRQSARCRHTKLPDLRESGSLRLSRRGARLGHRRPVAGLDPDASFWAIPKARRGSREAGS